MNKIKTTMWLASLGTSAALALSGGYLLIPHEGEVKDGQGYHIAYKDPVGITTFCWGLTGRDLHGNIPNVGKRYTDEECREMFVQRIQGFEKQIDNLVKVEYASDYQKASLISFTYNVGVGNLSSSTLLRKLNAEDHIGACEELSKWVYAQKKKLKGLVTRRAEEKQWCLGDVPYDVKDVYEEVINMSALPAPQETKQADPNEEKEEQKANPFESPSQPVNSGECGWFKRIRGGC